MIYSNAHILRVSCSNFSISPAAAAREIEQVGQRFLKEFFFYLFDILNKLFFSFCDYDGVCGYDSGSGYDGAGGYDSGSARGYDGGCGSDIGSGYDGAGGCFFFIPYINRGLFSSCNYN